MKTRPQTRWTQALAIKFVVYLIGFFGLIALVPTFREILRFLLFAAGIVVAGGVGVFLGLMLIGGLNAPRR
ncbi:hypothetical protein [Actinoplanes derwentensis]|uniref:Uncharacterized protein n=1 Tax=Actinoplanes derwentensis TaxID=113562 RepID=A0A1H2CUD6_9ACTN|nr:hypothetical protein [Actinoplanes derwentensis]GID81945.1 hypothetical protein Ade03nite_08690 [Actinoplanes derwentensis]SDT74160.1 hypothetical protein SAMN04489716_6896 [Actinoplanes derwentensis]